MLTRFLHWNFQGKRLKFYNCYRTKENNELHSPMQSNNGRLPVERCKHIKAGCLKKTSSSAIAERPRCRVVSYGQKWKIGTGIQYLRISLSSTSVT